MSLASARIPVLPRAIAVAITLSAVARSGWAIAAATLVVSIPGLISLYTRNGYGTDVVGPLVCLVVMIGGISYVSLRPSNVALAAYIVIGSLCVYFFLHGVLGAHPALIDGALILLNRPAVALVLVGTAGSKPLRAVFWGIGGFAAGELVTALVCLQLGVPIRLGNGPAITLANYSAAYLGLSFIQRAQRGRVPDFLRMRSETRQIEATRTAEQRATATLHDTVLNDLAFVINAPDRLDQRMRDSLRRDVTTLANTASIPIVNLDDYIDAGDNSLRNRLTALISEYQWLGLNVEVTGDNGGVVHLTPEVIEAAVGALRACLDNVHKHSGADVAEVIVSATDDSVSWTISDAGVGFDPTAVSDDRLGLRSSIVRRIELVGGSVRVWSRPGNGASVLITVPSLGPASPRRPVTDA